MSKVIVITGASAGIGLACAERLNRDGATVIAASRRGTSVSGSASICMDVDDDDDVKRGIEQVISEHGRIDGVVACAGWGLAGPVESTPISYAKDQFETNFWGTVRVVQAVLPTMRRQGGGRLVLVSSLGGLIALPFQAFYSASKFALEGYGEALAYEVAPFGVQVTLVEPGNFKTEFTAARRDAPVQPEDPYAAAASKAITLMEKDEANGADPAEVAKLVQKLLEMRRPPRRVSVGKMGERIGVVAKRVLPFSIFEKAASSSLGV